MFISFSLTLMFTPFENASSTTVSVMEEFHDFAMIYLTLIMTFLTVVIMRILMSKFYNFNFMENIALEIVWTVIPMTILIFLAYPSIFYLYLFDLSFNPNMTIKIFGAQWYWIYENFSSSENEKILLGPSEGEKTSYMVQDLELLSSNLNGKKGWRLLEVDNRLILPYGMEVQCLTTSTDVIHSFSIPDLGIKTDAIPGRLNSITIEILKPGTFYGQCSEICGTGHSFMPICMEAV